MGSQNSGWCVRVGDRLYSYSGGEDTVEIRTSHEEYQGSSRLLVPLVVGTRLLKEDQARFADVREAQRIARLKSEAEEKERAAVTSRTKDEPDDADLDLAASEDVPSQDDHPAQSVGKVLARRIRVFARGELLALKKRIDGQEKERAERMESGHELAACQSGLRGVPHDQERILAGLDGLGEQFPNLGAAVDFYRCELALALAGKAENFAVSPLLLAGAPGIGKTAFCRGLAVVIGGSFEEFSAGGTQAGFDLCGTSSHWSNCAPGRVFQALAEGDSACPVFLIDEVDKIRGSHQFPVLPTLLNLAERDSAARFRDECLGMKFDASHAVVVMTANDLSNVPSPLLSRVQVVEVPSPTIEQRRAIAARMLAALPPVHVSAAALDRLADSDSDLREVHRRLRRAVGDALARGAAEIAPDALDLGRWKPRHVGFVS